jgi:hypothetical protein
MRRRGDVIAITPLPKSKFLCPSKDLEAVPRQYSNLWGYATF